MDGAGGTVGAGISFNFLGFLPQVSSSLRTRGQGAQDPARLTPYLSLTPAST